MLALVLGVFAREAIVRAENWPQWRGPSANGVSGEKGLAVRWSKTENVTWRLALPEWSGSTAIVWGEHIFLNVAQGRDLFLWAVDRTKGDPIWKKHLSIGNRQQRKQNMSSPSPVTDGRHVWVMTGTGILKESPDAYTTPVLLNVGKTAEIVTRGGDVVTGHDPATGKELWRSHGLNPGNNPAYRIVASPSVFGDLIYAPSRERPILALRAGGRGDITATHRAWSFDSGPDVPTPVTDGTYFYVVRDNGVVFCLDAKTGKVIYGPQRMRPSTYSGSPVLADGKIYVTNEDGVTVVVRAGPKFEVLAENDLGEYTLSSPAISEGQIFIRTDTALYAIGKRVPRS